MKIRQGILIKIKWIHILECADHSRTNSLEYNPFIKKIDINYNKIFSST